MIIDNDPPITRHISVPRDMSQLSCSALTAGIVEAVLDGLGFVSTPILLLVTSIEAHGFMLSLLSRHASRLTRYRQISIRNARPSSSSSTKPSWSAKKPSNNRNMYKVQHSSLVQQCLVLSSSLPLLLSPIGSTRPFFFLSRPQYFTHGYITASPNLLIL